MAPPLIDFNLKIIIYLESEKVKHKWKHFNYMFNANILFQFVKVYNFRPIPRLVHFSALSVCTPVRQVRQVKKESKINEWKINNGGNKIGKLNCNWFFVLFSPTFVLRLQYSLLQTVVEACQKKKHCKFHGSPQFYGLGASGVGDSSGTSSYHSSTASSNAISSDPCPKRRKIVEIAYKCRPCKSVSSCSASFV